MIQCRVSQKGSNFCQGLPPLPTVPPPQPPPPPEPSVSWSAAVAAAPDSRVTESSGYSYPNYYHPQQGLEGNYGGQEGQVNSNTSSSASAPQSSVSANGSHSYGQVYPGYGATTSGDQFAYGSGNYPGYSYGYPHQQGNDSYSQNMGPPYQSSGAAPYPAINSFSSTSSYTDSASYQTTGTYYNAGVYQNTGGYPSTGYSSHASCWSDSSYGSYGGYSSYANYSTPDQSMGTGLASLPNSGQYQQDYPQWGEYYGHVQASATGDADSTSAPGTTGSVPVSSPPPTYASVVAQGAACNSVSSQPPPPGTQPSWQPSTQPLGVPSQGSSTANGTKSGGPHWDTSSAQSNQPEPLNHTVQNQFPPASQQNSHLGKLQCQTHSPPVFQQAQSLQPQLPQVLKQGVEQSVHSFQPQGIQQQISVGASPWRSGKLQIPTNPRIASNLGLTSKGTVGTEPAPPQKPVYISVGIKPSSSGKLSTDDVTDATLQPGMFPPSLRAYVERALSRCKDEAQKAACQDIMKEIITAASRDGSLFTKDWDTEPLFPLPNMPSTSSGKETILRTNAAISGVKLETSPNKRIKSRWEPVGEDEGDHKHSSYTHSVRETSRGEGMRDHGKERDGSVSPPKWEKREGLWNKTKSLQQSQQTHLGKRIRRGSKRGGRGLGANGTVSTSESDEELEPVGSVVLGSLVQAVETPEERKRRQSRTKRFDRGKETSAGLKGSGKGKAGVGGSASARRATALQLAMRYGDGKERAVEDIDWDSLTVRGTCQEIEKRYLRLTSAPDPSTVRPEEVLRKALAMVQSTTKNYLYKCEQLKSIRQDLTVQRIRDGVTVQVYETHARMALEAGDLPEYNQCQTQLKGLYAEGIKGCFSEFASYSLLYIIFQHGNSRDLLSSMARLSEDIKRDDAVKHALLVRAAVALGNYTTFFRLYRTAPNLSTYLMDLHVEKMRFEAVKCMTRSYRPSLPVLYIAQTLGFSGILSPEGTEEKETEGLEECEEWLKAHGAHLNFDRSSNEIVLDTKTSATSLFMPEPEDAVPHGDANLALNDFFART